MEAANLGCASALLADFGVKEVAFESRTIVFRGHFKVHGA